MVFGFLSWLSCRESGRASRARWADATPGSGEAYCCLRRSKTNVRKARRSRKRNVQRKGRTEADSGDTPIRVQSKLGTVVEYNPSIAHLMGRCKFIFRGFRLYFHERMKCRAKDKKTRRAPGFCQENNWVRRGVCRLLHTPERHRVAGHRGKRRGGLCGRHTDLLPGRGRDRPARHLHRGAATGAQRAQIRRIRGKRARDNRQPCRFVRHRVEVNRPA